MDTPNAETPGEQPSVTESAEVSEQLAESPSQDASTIIGNLTGDELDKLINEAEARGTQSPAPEANPAPEPAPQAQAQETAPDPDPQPESTTPQAPIKEGPLRRIPLGGVPEDQRTLIADATNLIRDGKAATLTEALTMLGHAPQPAAAPTETEQPQTLSQQQPAPTEQTPSSVAAIKTRIAELREQRKSARAEFDTDAELSLTDQIEDAQADLVRAEMAEREAAANHRSWEASHEQACDRVEAKYPQLEDPNSAFSRVLSDKVEAARARNDPAMSDPNFIESFADEVANTLGLTSPPPKAPVAKPQPAKGQAVAPGHQSAARPSSTETARAIQNLTPDELDAAINELERRGVNLTA